MLTNFVPITRLNVLRALISETNNAAKTNSPIQTDLQLLSLIRKRISASKDAAKEFESENRPDLKETEDRHIAILEEYGAQVKTMSVDDIKTIVAEELAKLKETSRRSRLDSYSSLSFPLEEPWMASPPRDPKLQELPKKRFLPRKG